MQAGRPLVLLPWQAEPVLHETARHRMLNLSLHVPAKSPLPCMPLLLAASCTSSYPL